jgi:broad specificity phosphatase PhoE
MRSEMRVHRAELSAAFPGLDFLRCREEWYCALHSRTGATLRAALAERPEQNILLVGHRGFVDYLVTGPFFNCGELGLRSDDVA